MRRRDRCNLVVRWSLAVLWGAWASAGTVRAQGPTLLPPPAAAATPPSYWVVSSRECRQSGCPTCEKGEFDYVAVSADGQRRAIESAEFAASLSPQLPICVIVHGSFMDWEELFATAPRVVRWLQGGGAAAIQFVFFTWPSEDRFLNFAPLDLGLRGVRASFNGLYLARFVTSLPPGTPVSLLGHSHGARTIVTALHLLGGGTASDLRLANLGPPRRLRTVLIAAAVDRHWIVPGERFGQALRPTERMLNLVNRGDWALSLYVLRKPFSNVALGHVGVAYAGRRRMGVLADRYCEFDVTALVGNGHELSRYFARPGVARAILPTLAFSDTLPAVVVNTLKDASAFTPWHDGRKH